MSPCVYHCVAFTRNNACAETWRVENEEKAEGWWKTHFPPRSVQPFGHACLCPLPSPPLPFPFQFRSSRNARRAEQKPGPKSENIGNKVNFWKSISATNNAGDKHVTSDLLSSKNLRIFFLSLSPFNLCST